MNGSEIILAKLVAWLTTQNEYKSVYKAEIFEQLAIYQAELIMGDGFIEDASENEKTTAQADELPFQG